MAALHGRPDHRRLESVRPGLSAPRMLEAPGLNTTTRPSTYARTPKKVLPLPSNLILPMSSSTPLLDVWDAAKGQPYYPAVAKNSQFLVGFLLLLSGTPSLCN